MTTSINGRPTHWPWPLVSAAIAAMVFALLHRVSIRVTPDGWAYWQGATSIVEGHGFRFFSGEPIATWLPLYPLYLAAWIGVAGSNTVTVAIANGVLIAAQAGLWTLCTLVACKGAMRTSQLAVAAYFGLYVPINLAFVRADLLMYALLPLLLLAAWQFVSTGERRYAWLATIVSSLMVITHHRSFIFIGSVAALMLCRAIRRTNERYRLTASAAAIVIAPMAAWLAVRGWLGQWDSHLVSTTAGRERSIDYFRQLVRSLGQLLSGSTIEPPRIALLIFAVIFLFVLWRSWSTPAFKGGTLFVALALTLTVTAFHVVFLEDDIDPRFVFFVPAVLVPLTVMALDALAPRLVIIVAIVLLVPLAIGTMRSIAAAQQVDAADTSEVIAHRARITSSYPAGPPVNEGGGRLVAPDQNKEPDERIREERRRGLRR